MAAQPFPTHAETLGTADWETNAPLWQPGSIWLGRNAGDVAVGCLDDRHMVTVAGSRAGKGRSAIVPNLALWPGSCVVLDPKGENATKTARWRMQLPGHRVVVIDPFGVAHVPDELRGTFNPLDLIKENDEAAVDIAAAIGDALVVPGDSRDSHWDESARQLLEALILHVTTAAPPERRNLAHVRRLLTEGDQEAMARDNLKSPFDALWADMVAPEVERLDALAGVIRGGAESLMSMGDNERGSVLSTTRRNTKFLDSPAIGRAIAGSTVDLDDLKTLAGGMSLYVCLPARFLATHARFLRMVINLVLFRMEAMGLNAPACGSSVLFVMDEFASLGRLEAIEKAAGLMAGYGVKLWPILQDLTQLKRHYKESWETFLGNAGLLQFFGNTDLTTLEWLEKRMGQTQITITTEGSSVAEADGKSEGITQAETKGTQKSAGKTEGHNQMAPLSSLTARQGGEGIIDSLTRSGASDVSVSGGTTTSEALSASNSESKQTGSSKSTTETRSLNQSAQVRPLCRVDEIARYFDRDTGLQVVFVSGGHPLVLKRTPYDTDPQFTALAALERPDPA
ncbi:TraM recognition domain-containing protein (plasmid) [Sphingobium sp. CAP-1]|nr:TraM recognition domain-containing protein [Sphingobium sp. CAP-1]QGP81518.1 TraM recognition domain-containing protein [Sphingobium sp. CAP-1]